jgi:hypothetical protein
MLIFFIIHSDVMNNDIDESANSELSIVFITLISHLSSHLISHLISSHLISHLISSHLSLGDTRPVLLSTFYCEIIVQKREPGVLW